MYEDGERIEDPLMEKQSGKSQTLEPPVLEGTAKRTVFTALICFGFFNVYAMRVNLSEAVLPMQLQYGWSDAEEGYVLSSFFWGYLCGQVIGALLAQKYGGKIVLGCGIFVTSALTLIIPLVSHNIYLLYAVRAIMGLGESVTYPAANVLYTKWAPAKERTFIVTMGSAGAYLGTAFAFPIAGFLIGAGEKKDAHTNMPTPSPHLHPTTSPTTAPTILMYSESWPMVFYVFGALGLVSRHASSSMRLNPPFSIHTTLALPWLTVATLCPWILSTSYIRWIPSQVWCMLWFWLASSSPAQHPTITDEEREYIEATVNEDADETCDKVTVTKSENPPIFQVQHSLHHTSCTILIHQTPNTKHLAPLPSFVRIISYHLYADVDPPLGVGTLLQPLHHQLGQLHAAHLPAQVSERGDPDRCPLPSPGVEVRHEEGSGSSSDSLHRHVRVAVIPYIAM
jgi:MFS family permease